MAYTVTDQDITNEMQVTLLETPNEGASYGSGLYTASEVAAALNYRLRDFYKRTGLVTKRTTDTGTNANQAEQNLPGDVIDILRVAYPDINGNTIAIMPGSATEADMFLSDEFGSNSAVDLPATFTLDTSGVLQILLLPPPNDNRAIDYVYVAQPTSLPTAPDGTHLECPDDFTPYIKYGALADLFGKTGETYDPVRAGMCEQLYELGVQMAKLLGTATSG